MKKVLTLMALGWVVMGVAGIGTPLSLCDYRSPETDLSSMHLCFHYRYFDDPETVSPDISSGRVALGYSRLVDSQSMGYSLAGTGEINLTDLQPTSGLGQAAGTLRFYLSEEMPYFAFGGLETSLATGRPQPGVEVRTGLGYGRFSDVTPLAKAFRIERKLLALEAIPHALTDEVLLAVAEEIGRQAEYETVDELVATVEGYIEEAAGVTLNARAILVIEEVILATGGARYCGGAVQAGIGYELIDPYGGKRDFVLVASADTAFAPEPGSQLLLRASFSGPFEIAEENTLTVSASYDYSVNGTTTLIAKYSLQRIKPFGLEATDTQSATLELAFNVGRADVAFQLALTKTADATGWSQDFVISAAMDLL